MKGDMQIKKVATVKVPTTGGKYLTLTREGDEIKVETPVTLKAPRVKVEDFKAGLGELTRDDG
jgi:hypothetical protein